MQVSYVDGAPQILTPGRAYPQFQQSGLQNSVTIGLQSGFHKLVGNRGKSLRARQWKYCDLDTDGRQDLVIGIGDWSDYGWDDAYNRDGQWTHGPLHGFVYWSRNEGTVAVPRYATPQKLQLDTHEPIDVFGWPSPNFADFDQDGDLDLVCGRVFSMDFTYFENVGSATAPEFATGERLMVGDEQLRMDLQMIVPTAIDWDQDGDTDLIVGDEDGRVALVENTGQRTGRLPRFRHPVYFRQQAAELQCGALSTPYCIDWDGGRRPRHTLRKYCGLHQLF